MNPATTTTTTTTFEETLETLAASMNESYLQDENGPIEMDEAQLDEVKTIVETVKEKAQSAFLPLYERLQHALEEQGEQIAALEAKMALANVAAKAAKAKGVAVTTIIAAQVAVADDGELPTVAWLKANRKSKKEGALTGYNCFTMWYMAKNKSGFPPKGTWETMDQKAYKAIASAYNQDTGVVKGAGAGAGVGADALDASIALPTMKGKGKALTAFNVWTNDYMAKNPGAGFPPKGLWAKVPKAEVARYQAQADALKAQRA